MAPGMSPRVTYYTTQIPVQLLALALWARWTGPDPFPIPQRELAYNRGQAWRVQGEEPEDGEVDGVEVD
eukprot:CAMPEP_0181323686 /NCGR_PEP_ID=MMETSP1101-20121128/19930_1 /TAXON_ID=46948 /ORGANISM="Rhodomonas abbreviata, Strain Caron Lab Isolate" /LENGTH=68 /DNA_ID=CAMNT_0023431755 /DNA_START=137 /DNA_END=343 /DNA_ORIENTATION=-